MTVALNTPGNYRIVLRISGGYGNGNAHIVFDNFETTNASLYNSGSGNCQFVAIASATLPVKLKYFTAQLSNNTIDLNWVTATEVNFSHFIIERSYNGIDFSDIATVFAFGNSTEEKKYQFSDKGYSSEKSVVYYRLRQVDNDGKAEYSAIRIIRNSKQAENNITILTYPNPVSNEVRITIPANWQNKKVVYEMFSVNGQTTKKIETANSSQTETLNVSNLNSGLYIVKVTCEGKTAQQKIIKQ